MQSNYKEIQSSVNGSPSLWKFYLSVSQANQSTDEKVLYCDSIRYLQTGLFPIDPLKLEIDGTHVLVTADLFSM